ncbi:hypothetical protein D1AOALGA4SA_11852 [Olavius algarvensis Delta 1 endosymbiont]|nr:hypothetical protein D1AOALGA4SA_11852 [Olavius algarvensis Delta 1 endosymbiont]
MKVSQSVLVRSGKSRWETAPTINNSIMKLYNCILIKQTAFQASAWVDPPWRNTRHLKPVYDPA